MNSYQSSNRQLRIALIINAIVIPTSVLGFMIIEDVSVLDAMWITLTTLATIGYGDIYATTELGRIFTIIIVVVGLGSFAFTAQATLAVIFSEQVTLNRLRRQEAKYIAKLKNHYIICGEGELVDYTIRFLLERVRARLIHEQQVATQSLDANLIRFIGQNNFIAKFIRHYIRQLYLRTHPLSTILDKVVVITQDEDFASHLRSIGLHVIEGDSSTEEGLLRSGIKAAKALMVMSKTDTETLLTVLTANSYNLKLYITASVLDEKFSKKMLRAGANNVIGPYDVAGQFLNNGTFRPAVNDFFNRILFDQNLFEKQIVQLFLYDDSPWIGQSLAELQLRELHDAGILAVRHETGEFIYSPQDNYTLNADEVLLVASPVDQIELIKAKCRENTQKVAHPTIWQPLPQPSVELSASRSISLMEATEYAESIKNHYIICDGGRIAHSAISALDPERPFVIVSDNNEETSILLRRGFRVIHGSPTEEETLLKAGIKRALAIMIATDNHATNVLTTLTSRTLNREILITAIAETDDMVSKLYRVGADRVINPLGIAAQFVLLATTRPVVSDFMQYVLFNRITGLETTELYTQHDSPWIGQTIKELQLWERYKAGTLAIRLENGNFVYSPPASFEIGARQIIIITVPMVHSDSLRNEAHGSETKRPKTLRQSVSNNN